MAEKTDEFLFGWAVKHAGNSAQQRNPRWVHVMGLFGLGSTSATALCKRFGADPDERVGGCSLCEQNMLCGVCDAELLGLEGGE